MASDRPVFVYDGQCGFCRCWVARWRHDAGDAVEFERSQDAASRFPEHAEAFPHAAHLIAPDGRVTRGAEAVFRMRALAGRQRLMLWAYERVPGVARASEAAYRFVAAHRSFFARFMSCGDDPANDPRGMNLTRWVFLRAMGVVYLLAFASLYPQILGLVGSNGILPANQLLPRVHEHLGREAYWQLPTVFWLGISDRALQGVCAAGMGLAGLLILDIAPAAMLVALWVLYLSITRVGNVFLQFQWDALLLETGFLAIFLAPLYVLPRRGRVPPAPSRIAVWLLRWLLFRLMILSGVVKLLSGDETWRNLTALLAHYETQPLSNWVAWYFLQAPLWFQKLSCGLMFFIELVVPILIFGGRLLRRIAFVALIFLQVMIIITGNYGFFNLLAIALCTMLLDDGAWPAWMRRRFGRNGLRRAWRWPTVVLVPVGAAAFLLSLVPSLHRVGREIHWPDAVMAAYRCTSPFDCFNSYGLFAAMTHSRPEIIVEGSDDGRTWKAYEFRYKPGDLQRRPPFVAPHMPRLDWQMWFAALGRVDHQAWFVYFCQRLLEGSKAVTALLEVNPFPDKPPRFVRATAYDYHFTNRAERAATGAWWRRDDQRLYCPQLDLGMLQRMQARRP